MKKYDVNNICNRLLYRLGLDSYEEISAKCEDITKLSEILKGITDFEVTNGIIEDSIIMERFLKQRLWIF